MSMCSSSEILSSAIAATKETLQSLIKLEPQVAKAADLIEQCLRAGNKLLVCGNGGSAADASHFATELVVRFAGDRPAYPAICLAGDGGLLTAAGNDYGFDEIFARQVAAFGMPGDVLICLTTSGKSKNVVRALEEAKTRIRREAGNVFLRSGGIVIHADDFVPLAEKTFAEMGTNETGTSRNQISSHRFFRLNNIGTRAFGYPPGRRGYGHRR